MVRAPTPCAYRGRKPHPTTEYRRAAATNAARGLMTAAVMKTDRRFLCPFSGSRTAAERSYIMAFFNSAVGVLQTLVIALGAGLGIWGVINLLEGYGNDNPGANAHG